MDTVKKLKKRNTDYPLQEPIDNDTDKNLKTRLIRWAIQKQWFTISLDEITS